MNIRSARHLLLTLVVAGATLASAASAQAWQEKRSTGTSATLRVDFGRSLHWTSIPGTRVEELPLSERPRYDVFRYGGSYYAFDDDRWYMSARERGDYREIDDQNVPDEFTAITRDHWRNYPSRWHGRSGFGDRDYSNAVPATLQVRVANSARWLDDRGRLRNDRGRPYAGNRWGN